MARTFQIILAGPDQDLITILAAAEEPLADLGFRRSRTLTRAEPGPAGGEDEEIEVRSLATDGELIAAWKGAYLDLRCSTFSLGLQVVRQRAGFVNAYLGIDTRDLGQAYAEDSGRFRAALTILAAACKAAGGLGATGLPFDAVPPDRVVQVFLDNPVNPGISCNLGLFATPLLDRVQVDRMAEDIFTVVELPGYWLLEDTDYFEITKKYS